MTENGVSDKTRQLWIRGYCTLREINGRHARNTSNTTRSTDISVIYYFQGSMEGAYVTLREINVSMAEKYAKIISSLAASIFLCLKINFKKVSQVNEYERQ